MEKTICHARRSGKSRRVLFGTNKVSGVLNKNNTAYEGEKKSRVNPGLILWASTFFMMMLFKCQKVCSVIYFSYSLVFYKTTMKK